MFLPIQNISSKKLIGLHLEMSLAADRTMELWRSFMPRRKEINALNTILFSLQVYPQNYDHSNLSSHFTRWALAEVEDFDNIPKEMQTFLLPEGKYAVFLHKGSPSEGYKTFQFIFGSWLPNSGYEIDNRPHFEILGEKYKNNSPDSEEEIWVPIK